MAGVIDALGSLILQKEPVVSVLLGMKEEPAEVGVVKASALVYSRGSILISFAGEELALVVNDSEEY